MAITKMFKQLFKRKKDLRELCKMEYGEDFVQKYDILASGGAIGGFGTTIVFIEMVEAVKSKYKDMYKIV